MADNAAKSYLSRVRRHLPRGEQPRHLAHAARLVEDFLAEDPSAQSADLETAFGTPADFAAAMVGQEGVARAKRQRQHLFLAVVALVLVIFIIVTAVLYLKWKTLDEIIPDDYYEIIPAVETLTPEEFEKIWNNSNYEDYQWEAFD